jgi:diguanylate cyclase (GGDEF)-like protein/putative nucleotidyltransferase with HDIG domain
LYDLKIRMFLIGLGIIVRGNTVKQNQKISEKKTGVEYSTQSNPIAPRKTANRLYGGYNHAKNFFGLQGSTVEPLEIFSEFCSEAKNKKSIDEILSYIHAIAINKLGYNFTVLGLVNNQLNSINLTLTDQVGNVYSTKIPLSETKNPIVECFISKTKKVISNINITNIPFDTPGVILPLINQNECIGVFVAGSPSRNEMNDEFLNVLINYLALLIINKKLSEKVSQNVNIDTLTGLNNHRGFQEKLTHEINNAQNKNQPVSIIQIDINNISQINREYGHAKGDEIICLVADKIKNNIRNGDIAGRYGGDEITVILPDTNNAEACKLAEYLNYGISCCLVDDIGTIKVSIGVATYPECAQEQEKLLLLAEQAMLISKSKSAQKGTSIIVSAQNIDFWNEMALDSLAKVVAKRHSQWGINFEDELVKKFQSESFSSNILDIVASLAGAIDAKDPYTKGHSSAVSRYAEALARAINLPESEIERIRLGAILHDVGKIGIPESILGKTSALTDQEWTIMMQHPQIGVTKVISSIHSLKDLIPIIKHHHENWDGTGYPDKIAGENIPFGARIVAVADAFHALISDRPYRKALSVNKAIEILRTGAGIQWDKNLVRKFIIIAPSLCTKV